MSGQKIFHAFPLHLPGFHNGFAQWMDHAFFGAVWQLFLLKKKGKKAPSIHALNPIEKRLMGKFHSIPNRCL